MMTKTLEKRLDRIEEELGIANPVGTTYLGIVLDESKSMDRRRKATIDGFNDYIGELKSDDEIGDVKVALTRFSSDYTKVHTNTPLRSVKKLTKDTYRPSGMTALYDAVGVTIDEIDENLGDDDRALIVVMTDGFENKSTEYTGREISAMIEDRQDRENWTFVFLGAGIDAFAGGTDISIKKGNTFSYGDSPAAQSATYGSLARASRSFLGSGSTATSSFAAAMSNDADLTPDWDSKGGTIGG